MTGESQRRAFVGRSVELATLDAVEAARGSLVLLSGEAGAGKTTLVERALTQTDRRQLTVRVPGEEGVSPWWPWRRLARALPAIDDALSAVAALSAVGHEPTDPSALRAEDAAAVRFRLHDAVAQALAAQAAAEPLVVVLEDAHLLDAASAALLGHLVTALDDEPLVLVATYRDPAPGTEGWRRVLPRLLRSPRLTRIRLSGLTREDCADYVAAINGRASDATAAFVRDLTGGNALYVTTLVDALQRSGDLTAFVTSHAAGSLPGGNDIAVLVGDLVTPLPEATRILLAASAVLGHDITVPRLATLTGTGADAVTRAAEPALVAGVLVDAMTPVEHRAVRLLPCGGPGRDLRRGAGRREGSLAPRSGRAAGRRAPARRGRRALGPRHRRPRRGPRRRELGEPGRP